MSNTAIKNRIIIFLYIILLAGCGQGEEENDFILENKEAIYYVQGWHDEMFDRHKDSFKSSFEALLTYYGVENSFVPENPYRREGQFGKSFLQFFDQLGAEYNIFSTFIDADFDQVKNEILMNNPVIVERHVRHLALDYVLLVGYNGDEESFIGYTVLSQEPIVVAKQDWVQVFQVHGENRSIFTSKDYEKIEQLRGISKFHWWQEAVDGIIDRHYPAIERAVNKLKEVKIHNGEVDYHERINLYRQLFIKKEIDSETKKYLAELNTKYPENRYTLEWNFHSSWLLGDKKQALDYMQQLEETGPYESLLLETLDLFREIYKEEDNIESLNLLETAYKIRSER